jgi:hypothetical protein
MRLRPQRRSLVVWRQSDRAYEASRVARSARTGRIRRRIRIVFLLTVVALWPLVRAVRARWRPLLAGAALTAVGVAMRGSTVGSLVLFPGLLLLFGAPLLPGTPEADRLRRSELERELATYTTTRQRFDLTATLDQYPDEVTCELRDILARQDATAAYPPIPGCGRR